MTFHPLTIQHQILHISCSKHVPHNSSEHEINMTDNPQKWNVEKNETLISNIYFGNFFASPYFYRLIFSTRKSIIHSPFKTECVCKMLNVLHFTHFHPNHPAGVDALKITFSFGVTAMLAYESIYWTQFRKNCPQGIPYSLDSIVCFYFISELLQCIGSWYHNNISNR